MTAYLVRRTTAALVGLLWLGVFSSPPSAHAQTAPVLLWKTVRQPASTTLAVAHHKHLIAFADYQRIDLWDDDGAYVSQTLATDFRFDQLRFSSDDRVLIGLHRRSEYGSLRFGGEANVRVVLVRMDLRTGKENATYITRPRIFDATLSSDGEELATVDDHGWLTLYSSDGTTLDSVQLPGVDPGPHEYFHVGVVFNRGDRTVTAISRGRAFVVRVPKLTIDHEIIFRRDSVEPRAFEWFTLDPDRVFLQSAGPFVLKLPSGNLAELQPPAVVRDKKSRGWSAPARLDDALLLQSCRLLISRYAATTWAIPIDGPGPRSGIDSLIFQNIEFPTGFWSIHVSPGMIVHGELPWKKDGILMSDGSRVLEVFPKTRTIDTLVSSPAAMVGLVGDSGLVLTVSQDELQWRDTKTGRLSQSDWLYYGGRPLVSPNQQWIVLQGEGGALESRSARNEPAASVRMHTQWEGAFLDSNLLLLYQDLGYGAKREPSVLVYTVPQLNLIDSIAELGRYRGWQMVNSFHPAGRNRVLTSGGDSAILFNFKQHTIERVFPAGLNYGLAASAISHDRQWVVTVNSYTNDAKLWRTMDGALKATFRLPKTGHVEFTPNDRYLLTMGYGAEDSCLFVTDPITGDRQAICADQPGLRDFYLARDGQFLGISRNGLTEVYITPASWREVNTLHPPKSYLPFRFYVPATARAALDTTGLPYTPARTDIILELRYADGRVIKRLLDGNFHSGKWHEWTYDMTEYPKGTYIMHTEIGGVIKDERMELK